MERCPSPAMQAAMDDAAGGKRSPATPYALALAAITSVESPFRLDGRQGGEAGTGPAAAAGAGSACEVPQPARGRAQRAAGADGI